MMTTTARSSSHQSISCLALLCALSFISGCGAVSKGNSPSSQSSSVVVTPATAQIRAGDTQLFAAMASSPRPVSGSSNNPTHGRRDDFQDDETQRPSFGAGSVRPTNPGVTWSVNDIRGGNETVGTIDAKGLYTAPTNLPNPNSVKVTATSTAEPSAAATVPVTLKNPIPIVTSISPTTVSVGSFTLTVNGRGFVKGAQVLFAGTALQTVFNSAAQLTATGAATQAQVGNWQISVKNPDPGSASSTEVFNVQVSGSPAVKVSVSPLNTALRASEIQQFTALLLGTSNPAVTWSVNGVAGGNATLGTISPDGLYRAPVTLPNPNTVRVIASSIAAPSVSATAPVTLNNPIPIVTSVSPTTISAESFKLTVSGSRFARGAQVLFDGTALQTTFGSTTQLTATGTASQAHLGNRQISVKNPDPGSASSTTAVNVQVVGTPQVAVMSPNSLSFGNQAVNRTSAPQTIMLSNPGNAILNISGIAAIGNFAQTNSCPASLSVGGNCTITVMFRPPVGGGQSGVVIVTEDAQGSPQQVTLNGTGLAPVQHYSEDLTWDAITSSVIGYNVYRGTQSGGPYTKLTTPLEESTFYTDATVESGQSYFYVVTAVDANNEESGISNEILVIVPTP
jgi:hypothetical protein